jgi:hypothetical protein
MGGFSSIFTSFSALFPALSFNLFYLIAVTFGILFAGRYASEHPE